MVTLNSGPLQVNVLDGKPKSLRQAINITEEYMAILDPNGDGRRGDLEATTLAYPGSSQVLSSIPSAAVCTVGAGTALVASAAPTGHAAQTGKSEVKVCLATQAINELTHAFQQFTPAPAGQGTGGQHPNSKNQGPRKGKG